MLIKVFFFSVIGIQPASKEADIMYDILFDEAFNGGLTLRGPASAKKCYRLHWAAMINISHGSKLANTAQKVEFYYYSKLKWICVR